jgi:hypothetical protein
MSADSKDLHTEPPRRNFLKYLGFSCAAATVTTAMKTIYGKAVVIGSGIKGLNKEELAARLQVPVADMVIIDQSQNIDLRTKIEEDRERGIEILKADLEKPKPFQFEARAEMPHFFKEQPNYITGKKLPKKKRRK